jgi:flagellin-like protein
MSLTPPGLRRSRLGVSPVIATILMVAITVVLAAVLYVMVSGLIGPTGGGNPTVAFLPAKNITGGWRIDIGSVSQSVALGSYKVAVLDGTTVAIPATTVTATMSATSTGVTPTITLRFTDLNGDGKLTGGDFFVLSGTFGTGSSGHTYELQLLWTASGSKIVGQTVST